VELGTIQGVETVGMNAAINIFSHDPKEIWTEAGREKIIEKNKDNTVA
jgi:hypothetical protein